MAEMTEADAGKKVQRLLKDAHIAMMATRHDDGTMHARPMGTNHAEFEGTLWFLTDVRSEKVSDIDRHPEVLLTYSDEHKQNYVSITGQGQVIRNNPALVHEHWAEPVRAWFPDGPDDPNIAVIRVDVDRAEYWDSPAGAVVLAYGYVKAAVTGKPADNVGDNRTVRY